jgi:hypothetical protein
MVELAALPSEEHEQIAADPFLRLAVIAELPFVRVESAIVVRAEYVMKIFVMDYRLDEERRDPVAFRSGWTRISAV